MQQTEILDFKDHKIKLEQSIITAVHDDWMLRFSNRVNSEVIDGFVDELFNKLVQIESDNVLDYFNKASKLIIEIQNIISSSK